MTRSPRPSKVQFKVGQVIKHKNLDLYGVIVGWDEVAQAPQNWIDRNYDEFDVISQFYFRIGIFYYLFFFIAC